MQRRDFLAASLAAAPALANAAHPSAPSPARADHFSLKYAPHFGMFSALTGSDNPIDELAFAADQGFTAWEDNGMMHRPVEQQEAIAREMQRLNMTMGVFVASPSTSWDATFVAANAEFRSRFLDECRRAVDIAKRVNAAWMTVVPGTSVQHLEWDYQTANVVDQLRAACEIFEPHNLVMVLEPLNPWRDHPGMFLTKVPQAYQICRAVNSPSCKILFDMYHQQITEGNIIPNIDAAWTEIAYFQIGDNPGRCEPGTGEMNYRNIFRHIRSKGFQGVLGMEHGNSTEGPEGAQAVIDAYRAADAP